MDQVTNCISEDELQSLSQSWKVAYVSMIISKSALVSGPEFDVDEVKGKVVTVEEVKIPALQMAVVKGLPLSQGTRSMFMCLWNVHLCVQVYSFWEIPLT